MKGVSFTCVATFTGLTNPITWSAASIDEQLQVTGAEVFAKFQR